METILRAKASLREQIRATLNNIPLEQRVAASSSACALLQKQSIWINARSILFFAPLRDEPDIWPLLGEALKAGKSVALPRFIPETNSYTACQIGHPDNDIEFGRFGIREPAQSCAHRMLMRLDLVLVPGVAFDLLGRRHGRGKGFYDHLLATGPGPTCGVAFNEQIVNQIPVAPHDVLVNCILTPTRWIEL
jgi:5-formyltetrahydrofolate cyclo-ligase